MVLGWYESKKLECMGSDDIVSGGSVSEIIELADGLLDDESMVTFVSDYFNFQKDFADFLGVGESTVAGWIKNRSFPDYSKRAVLAAYYANKHDAAVKRASRGLEYPLCVRDGERFIIVKFESDIAGISIGTVVAKDIQTEKTARVLASSLKAWSLLGRAQEVLEFEIERMDPDHSGWIRDLNEEARVEKLKTFSRAKYVERLEAARLARDQASDLDVGDLDVGDDVDDMLRQPSSVIDPSKEIMK